jgi:hypothetical protein
LKLIEDIYSRRFVEDTAYFKSSVGGEENGETQTLDIPSSSFPSFVFSYLTNKYKHAKLIHQVLTQILIFLEWSRFDQQH